MTLLRDVFSVVRVVLLISGILAGFSILSSCDEDGTAERAPTEEASAASPSAPAHSPLTEGDESLLLRVVGRDALRLCVQPLDAGQVGGERAEAALGEALAVAAADHRWPTRGFGAPQVETGCPLPPAALDEDVPRADRAICREEASPFLAYAFVGNEEAFSERFPDDVLQIAYPVPGIRRAPQEYLGDGGRCDLQVAEAWYLTESDLADPELLQHYIFGLFPIAEVGR